MNKSLLLLLVLLISLTMLNAIDRQVYIYEDFTSTTFPPTGWTISNQSGNWSRFAGASAGGSTPELRLRWDPQFNNSTYFTSPQLDLSGLSSVSLEFRHFLDHYATPYTIGVATRNSPQGTWNVAWSANPNANIGPELRSIQISNADVGSATFQFAFFFSGNSYNLDYWFIDNIKLFTPFANDLAIHSVSGANQVVAGTTITPACEIKNVGLSNLTATVSLTIYEWETQVASYPDHFSQSIDPGQIINVTFPTFIPMTEDEMYRFEYSITSLEDVVDDDPTNNVMSKWVATWTSPKQQVLLEIGTGGWCPYCPGASMAAHDMLAQGLNVAVIKNHNGDPYATDASNYRNSYYGISGYPTGVFDGLLRHVGGSNSSSIVNSYMPLFNQRVDIKSPIDINLYGSYTGTNFVLTTQIAKYANLVNPNLVLHTVITESEIPYNWQGQTQFDNVNRMMLPDHFGTPVDLASLPVGVHNFQQTFTAGASWVLEHCELVAFVQDLDTKEVIQANKHDLLSLEEPPVANSDPSAIPQKLAIQSVYPNPFNPQTTVSFSLPLAGKVSLFAYNIKGQEVFAQTHQNLPAGSHNIVFNAENLPSGVYYLRLKSDSSTVLKKVMLMK